MDASDSEIARPAEARRAASAPGAVMAAKVSFRWAAVASSTQAPSRLISIQGSPACALAAIDAQSAMARSAKADLFAAIRILL